ncbi:MAG TPA: hypothetical protein VG125_05890 [Pirellulales bacterium]|jgi:hypothetical protein|nr:hypothetical protein [Pirellulales bacterium]
MSLATYCGLLFVSAAVLTYMTSEPLSLSGAALGASGVGAWSIVGWAFCRRYRLTAYLAGALGVVALLLLTV